MYVFTYIIYNRIINNDRMLAVCCTLETPWLWQSHLFIKFVDSLLGRDFPCSQQLISSTATAVRLATQVQRQRQPGLSHHQLRALLLATSQVHVVLLSGIGEIPREKPGNQQGL